jgi:hypothetical protein
MIACLQWIHRFIDQQFFRRTDRAGDHVGQRMAVRILGAIKPWSTSSCTWLWSRVNCWSWPLRSR